MSVRTSLSRLGASRRFNELVGVTLLAFAVLAALAIVSYRGEDTSWFHRPARIEPTRNWMGPVGAYLAEALLQTAGIAALLVPVIAFVVGFSRFRGRSAAASYGKLIGHALLLLSLTMVLDLLYGGIEYGGERFPAGGFVGQQLAGVALGLLNRPGALLLALALLSASLVVTTRFSLADAASAVSQRSISTSRALAARLRAFREDRRRSAQKRAVMKKHAESARASRMDAPAEAPAASISRAEAFNDRPAPRPPEPRVAARAPKGSGVPPPPPPRQPALPLPRTEPGLALPPLELLHEPEDQAGEDEKELLARARELTEKFREFAVEGSVVAIHPGPVVTVFEFKPEAGVKYSKITSLVDDLCLGLKAESIRIDRIPGRSTVGIEVPNRRKETIFPKDLFASERFRHSKSKLTLALGKDIGGEVFCSELDRMPHLLIAGATGAGKSVGLNGMIASILYKATPTDVRFIMIDTKMIELGIYADIPHLLIPVVTDPKAASTALKWAVREMEQRYRQLASCGVRNIEQFNSLLEAEPGRTMPHERTGEAVPLKRLPYVVIVIDEMADLMMVSSADVEESVMRLAQMARAVGIHLILATQRPSVDVLTGTIKANFPARIAFRVSQRVDSRTIIDQQGAEHLLGRGDMLFLPPGSSRLVRVHGGYVTEAEINRITAFLKKQARPIYDESVLKEPEEERGAYDAGERDELFVEAVRTILQEGQCSITLIQRRMRLGYARAARIVDTMEREGIIGPADGSKPREVLVGPEVLETLEAHR